ncbi:hypothetical protein [Companilactobacillus kimchii]|uniref:DUF5067 domain-containing protein n=2 Tax=Companilactobacillus kimchii TaxID=2801452 RepID=A0ABR5NQG7_9LACO|nr:hypothetical protein [Companilactobacillus kimchii]KAE9562876.1 hypothetical protein ATN91_01560 [Companilactobacillus kimchii]KRK49910.1 hypothetical protein FC97_GL002294 [Companilactobacillus kimchii DSM 13961 = JCM 10707]OWF33119.1 Serine-rich adhesin for platelets [Companilactobacillus kimchii]GEO46796.1 hypothetical protein LKI01_07950 [Companilactobacillus paralimentarius]
MSKKALLIGVMCLLLISAGCANKADADKSTSDVKATETTEKTVDYTSLSQSERNELTFLFTRSSQDPVSVDLKIINRTNKNISFINSDFILMHTKSDKVRADKDGDSTIDSNSTKTVKNLFEDVELSEFQTVGLFVYKSADNELAYSETAKLSSRSSNLTNSSLENSYKQATKVVEKTKQTKQVTKSTNSEIEDSKKDNGDTTSTVSTNANDSTSTSTDDNKNADNKTESNDNSSSVGTVNADQAMNIIKSHDGNTDKKYSVVIDQNGGTAKTYTDGNGQTVYWIHSTDNDGSSGDDWTVYSNGLVMHSKPNL